MDAKTPRVVWQGVSNHCSSNTYRIIVYGSDSLILERQGKDASGGERWEMEGREEVIFEVTRTALLQLPEWKP